MNWSVRIERVSNGYILEMDTRDNDLDVMHRMIFEEKESYNEHDERKVEIETFVSLIHQIADFFGVFNNKHKPYNLELSVREE